MKNCKIAKLEINPNDKLVDNLISSGYLKTPRIIEAFCRVDRADFVPEEYQEEAYVDAPLPIGHDQTISQPATVAFMLELLQPQPGNRILDVGSGSGWTTALLAEIVDKKGKVCAIERIPELCDFGKKNIAKYKFGQRVEMICADGTKGYTKGAPFDRILAGASGRQLPEAWREQLKTGGKIVAPIEWSVWLFIKKGESRFEEIEHPGFAFVPLISES